MLRYVLMGIAWVAFALGLLGVFVPVLPTTPFMLLAAFLFARTSPRMDAWIKSTKLWKAYGQPFKESGGIAKRKKIHIIAVSYLVLAVSAVLVQRPIVWAVLAGVALFLAWLMLVRIPTVEQDTIAHFVDPAGAVDSLADSAAERHAAGVSRGELVQ